MAKVAIFMARTRDIRGNRCILLRPLPFPDSDRLVLSSIPTEGRVERAASLTNYTSGAAQSRPLALSIFRGEHRSRRRNRFDPAGKIMQSRRTFARAWAGPVMVAASTR